MQSERIIKDFYRVDKGEYELLKNYSFLRWYMKQIIMGYEPIIGLKGLQGLIDSLYNFYEYTYPPRDNLIIDDTNIINLDCLKYYLNKRQLFILNPYFRLDNLKNGNLVTSIDMGRDKKNISIDRKTGIISDKSLKQFDIRNDGDINIYWLLNYFFVLDRKDINCDNLEKIALNKKVDLELRNIILDLTAKKIFFSKNSTNIVNNYIRCKKFINDFNNNFDNLNLLNEDIDNIFNSYMGISKIKTKCKKEDSC